MNTISKWFISKVNWLKQKITYPVASTSVFPPYWDQYDINSLRFLVGISTNIDEEQVSIAVIDLEMKKKYMETFRTGDAIAAQQFIKINAINPLSSRVLITAAETINVELSGEINHFVENCPIIDISSFDITLLRFLKNENYINGFQLLFDQTSQKVIVINDPVGNRLRQPSFLQKDILYAYADLLDIDSAHHSRVALAALLCRNLGAFYYWISTGRVFSAQDIVMYLMHGRSGITDENGDAHYIVITFSDRYEIITHDSSRYDEINKVPIIYSREVSNHLYLGENNALKAAVISVCKEWRLSLHCSSATHKTNGIWPQVFPLIGDDLWIFTK